MTMEARLLLAFVLMGLVLFGTQYFYKPPPQPPEAGRDARLRKPPRRPEARRSRPKPPRQAPRRAGAQVDMPGQVQADKEETAAVDTDLYHVVFSNRGAVVRSWVLKDYKDHNGKPLDLVNQRARTRAFRAPFSLNSRVRRRPPIRTRRCFASKIAPTI